MTSNNRLQNIGHMKSSTFKIARSYLPLVQLHRPLLSFQRASLQQLLLPANLPLHNTQQQCRDQGCHQEFQILHFIKFY